MTGRCSGAALVGFSTTGSSNRSRSKGSSSSSSSSSSARCAGAALLSCRASGAVATTSSTPSRSCRYAPRGSNSSSPCTEGAAETANAFSVLAATTAEITSCGAAVTVLCRMRPVPLAASPPPSLCARESNGLLHMRQRAALAGTRLLHDGQRTNVRSLGSLAMFRPRLIISHKTTSSHMKRSKT